MGRGGDDETKGKGDEGETMMGDGDDGEEVDEGTEMRGYADLQHLQYP